MSVTLTPRQVDLARHALGLPNKGNDILASVGGLRP